MADEIVIPVPTDATAVELPTVAWEITWGADGHKPSNEIQQDKQAADQFANFLEQKGEPNVTINSLVSRSKVYALFRRIRAPVQQLTDDLAEYKTTKWTPEFNELLNRLKADLFSDDRVVAVNFRLGFPKIYVFMQSMQTKLRTLERDVATPIVNPDTETEMVKDLTWRGIHFVRDDVSLRRVTLAASQLRIQFEKNTATELRLQEAERRITDLVAEKASLENQVNAAKSYIQRVIRVFNESIGVFRIEYTANIETLPTMLETAMKAILNERAVIESKDAFALASRETKQALQIVTDVSTELKKFIDKFQAAADTASQEREAVELKANKILLTVMNNESMLRRWVGSIRSLFLRLQIPVEKDDAFLKDLETSTTIPGPGVSINPFTDSEADLHPDKKA